MAKSTKKRPVEKPAKPHKDYPLFAHNSGRWCKKVKGRFIYLGPWNDPDGALRNWLDEKDYILAHGCRPPEGLGGSTIRDLCNRFLTAKETSKDVGEITERTFNDYHRTCQILVKHFGKERSLSSLIPADFEKLRSSLATTRKLVSLGNEINRVRIVFRFAYENDLVDRPVKTGSEFKRPSRKAMRVQRAARGPKLFEPAEIKSLIEKANPTMAAMLWLAINGGMGNSDVARLEFRHVKDGWIHYPRPKTGIARRFPMWPETARAVQLAIDDRKQPLDESHANIVFLTHTRRVWFRDDTTHNPVSGAFTKLAERAKIERGAFYWLRHCFETIASETRDQPAVDHVMGHGDESMAAVYRERIDDERLQAVVDHVRTWLFGNSETR